MTTSMKCEKVSELLPDYLQGSLDHEAEDQVETHLHQCAACREVVTLWNTLGALPEEQPSPMLRARFNAMLHAYQAARGDAEPAPRREFSFWTALWRPAAALAAAAVLLVAGFSAGKYVDGREKVAQANVDRLHDELGMMRQLLVLSMLQQQSASERLQGVSYSTQAPSDPRVVEALLHTLRYDNSVDVRLAALDALSRQRNQPMVRDGMRDALEPGQSPLVQLELIRNLVEIRDTQAVGPMQKIRQTKDVNPLVRERVDWALSRLH